MSKDYAPFANRLRKMAKHYGKWARRQELEVYRVYDADLDEFPIILDRYADQVYVSLYHRKGEEWTEDDYQDRKLAYREIITEVLGVGRDQVFFKLRKRQTGTNQYEKLSIAQREFTVVENGLGFVVNLTDYLDTGLYSDQRELRMMVAREAKGKRVLHLFAYTCALGTYAAAADAFRVDSLEMSNTYLEWGERNFVLNEIATDRHRFIREDIMPWLKKPNLLKYDIIVITPPTFSNSKSMREPFDLQQDHPKLINYCLPKLNEGGKVYFLTNARKFKLEEELIKGVTEIKDITKQTLPPDHRKRNLHRCWRMS
ncbi:class I SAM-dependent methyltransferase [Neolewinella persica]|uniref:class I SAM-dependent methyltransferase n=1 Tax=Neolewinella persica TaxID=70998 RepID=UPI00035EBE1D|nr:class I SAM-dependent methyltransferase [Neolewinella persica]